MYGKYECFVMHVLYICVHPVAVQCYILCDLQSGNTGCGCKSHTWDFINSSYLSFSNTCLATSSSRGVHHFNTKSIGSKRHSIHAVELSQWYGKPCAYFSGRPVPALGARLPFLASRPCGLTGWLVMLLIKVGDKVQYD